MSLFMPLFMQLVTTHENIIILSLSFYFSSFTISINTYLSLSLPLYLSLSIALPHYVVGYLLQNFTRQIIILSLLISFILFYYLSLSIYLSMSLAHHAAGNLLKRYTGKNNNSLFISFALSLSLSIYL